MPSPASTSRTPRVPAADDRPPIVNEYAVRSARSIRVRVHVHEVRLGARWVGAPVREGVDKTAAQAQTKAVALADVRRDVAVSRRDRAISRPLACQRVAMSHPHPPWPRRAADPGRGDVAPGLQGSTIVGSPMPPCRRTGTRPRRTPERRLRLSPTAHKRSTRARGSAQGRRLARARDRHRDLPRLGTGRPSRRPR